MEKLSFDKGALFLNEYQSVKLQIKYKEDFKGKFCFYCILFFSDYHQRLSLKLNKHCIKASLKLSIYTLQILFIKCTQHF